MSAQPPVHEIGFTLNGNIDAALSTRVFASFGKAVNDGVITVHLLIQSTGGMVNDGVALYNFLRNLPLRLITYNAGNVSSAAVPIFLAGTTRYASVGATFLIHATKGPAISMSAAQMKGSLKMIQLDDQRTKQIIQANCSIPTRLWQQCQHSDVAFSATDAKTYGVINDIKDFGPIKPLYNI